MFSILTNKFPALEVKFNEPISEYTFMKVGGSAIAMAFPKSVQELSEVLLFCDDNNISMFFLGRGSNLIVNDEGVDVLVINTLNLKNIISDNDNPDHIIADSGVDLKDLSEFCCSKALSGLEFACGIPGTVGGAVVMNAGAYGGEMKDAVVSVTAYVLGEGIRVFTEQELCFEYRKSVFTKKIACVLQTVFRLEKGDIDNIRKKIEELTQRREEKQPLNMPSAGSTFKRPEGYFAGKLITDAGLKGFKIGGAAVSEKHAGFLVNVGGAKAQDLVDLITHIRVEVQRRFDVNLEPEVKFLQKDGTFKRFN